MQIESLKVFCDLAETESFTKAAQINTVTQSAVSQQISSLERQFKSLLIERSKKKFRLTREGQVLYEYSKQIIQTYDSLQNRLQEIKDIISGTIRVATIYSIGLHDLPPYVKKFLKSYPTVNVHLEYRRANQVYEDVLSNVVDLGLVAYPSRDPKIEMVPLRKDTLVLICNPQHPLAKFKSIKLSQLAGQKFVGFEPDIPTRKAIDKVLKDHGVAVETVMAAMRATGLSGYRNDSDVSIGRSLRDVLSSPIMINNDRILSSLSASTLLSEIPSSIRD